MNEKTTYVTIFNPKSVPMKDLYGEHYPMTSEWNDGIFTVKFRDYTKMNNDDRKWIVFDGPVDALWIENMNTVLDDNRMLCLNNG